MNTDQYAICGQCGHVLKHHPVKTDQAIPCEKCGHRPFNPAALLPSCNVEGCSCPYFIPIEAGNMTCGGRMYELGPWEKKKNLDTWITSKWGPFYGAKWPEEFTPPRTCSFCGSANPDDVVGLIERGWEVERTDKKYKFYLHPPGYNHYQMLDRTLEGAPVPFPSVVPPVKIYTMHIEDEETWYKIVHWTDTTEGPIPGQIDGGL